MTAKLLQHNRQVVYRSTYQPLIIEKTANEQVQIHKQSFKESSEEYIGAKLMQNKLEEVGIYDTPEYMPYAIC